VLLKNVAVVVNLEGQQPRGWPQQQQWSSDSSWHGCLPWQVGVQASGFRCRGFSVTTVISVAGVSATCRAAGRWC
jgi:hypothetical protein